MTKKPNIVNRFQAKLLECKKINRAFSVTLYSSKVEVWRLEMSSL